MSRIRFSKVRVTDYRPPGAGPKPALERSGATRGGSVARLSYEDRLAMEHDKAVENYGPALLEAAYRDIKNRPCRDSRDPEQRWTRHRKAALLRAAQGMKHKP